MRLVAPKSFSILTAIMLVVGFAPSSPGATAKAGTTCSKKGLTQVSSGKKYTCVLKNKKLVWNQGVAIKSKVSPAPFASSTPEVTNNANNSNSPSMPNSNSAPTPTEAQNTNSLLKPSKTENYQNAEISLDSCKLKETANLSGAGAKGFPIRNQLAISGEIKIAIIPIDFENAQGTGSPKEMYKDDLSQISNWAEYYGRGKITYKASLVSDNWLRAPKGADWYVCMECQKGAKAEKQSKQIALRELIDLADKNYDFTGTDFIYFVFPYEAEQLYGTAVISNAINIATSEGNIFAAVYGELGGFFMKSDREKIWDHLIHELLHFQGFVGHGPLNGSGLGILTNQWGQSKSLNAWEGFMAGWYGDNEILCLDSNKISTETFVNLSSIDNFGNTPEAIFLKLNEQALIVIERRTEGPFTKLKGSRELPNGKGFVAYYLDVNKAQYRNDSDPNSESKNFWFYLRENGNIALTTKVTFEGLTIEIINEEQVSISKKT